MKKLAIAAVLGSAFAMSAHAAPNNVGCGLGSMVFEGQSGVAPQILAATTNGSFGNQTFGISSGTLGCKSDGVVQLSQRVNMFTGSNMDALAQDMSVGHGESIATLADLMGIADEDKGTFFSVSKDNFSSIFSSADITAEQMLGNLQGVMAEDAALAPYVS